MGFIEQINYGERMLMCAIIESAINDFVSMADDPSIRSNSVHFKTAEEFLFGNGVIERILLRDPKTGEALGGRSEDYIGCTLKRFAEMLTINGQPLNVRYIREGVIKKLEKNRREKVTQDRHNWWTPYRN